MSELAKLIAIPIDFELIDGRLSVRGAHQLPVQASLGTEALSELAKNRAVLLFAKRGDYFPVAVGFTHAGAPVNTVQLTSLRAGLKEFEPETLVALNSNEGTDFEMETIAGVRRFIVPLDFGAARLGQLLAGYEDDAATLFDAPFEIEAVFSGALLTTNYESLAVSLAGGHSSTETFTFGNFSDPPDGDYRLTVTLTVGGIYAAYGWPSQSVAISADFSIVDGTPWELAVEGSLSGQGASPAAGQWRTSLTAVMTGENDGIEVEVGMLTSSVSAQSLAVTMPEGWSIQPTTGIFYRPNPAVGEASPVIEVLDGDGEVTSSFALIEMSGTPPAGYARRAADCVGQDKIMTDGGGVALGWSATQFIVFGQITTAAVRDAESLVTYPRQAFGGHTIAATLEVRVEKIGEEEEEEGPYGAANYVRTSQTATVRIERDLLPN